MVGWTESIIVSCSNLVSCNQTIFFRFYLWWQKGLVFLWTGLDPFSTTTKKRSSYAKFAKLLQRRRLYCQKVRPCASIRVWPCKTIILVTHQASNSPKTSYRDPPIVLHPAASHVLLSTLNGVREIHSSSWQQSNCRIWPDQNFDMTSQLYGEEPVWTINTRFWHNGASCKLTRHQSVCSCEWLHN